MYRLRDHINNEIIDEDSDIDDDDIDSHLNLLLPDRLF